MQRTPDYLRWVYVPPFCVFVPQEPVAIPVGLRKARRIISLDSLAANGPPTMPGIDAATRSKNTYLAAQYHRLAARRGAKRAIVAMAHAIVVIIYHLLARQEPCHELGGNYFDERRRESGARRLVHRLEKLGYQVVLATKPAGASIAAACPQNDL